MRISNRPLVLAGGGLDLPLELTLTSFAGSLLVVAFEPGVVVDVVVGASLVGEETPGFL